MKSPNITKLIARQIFDSRGKPTIEVDIISEAGIISRAAVPSGASTGIYEALELRDGDKNEYLGQGVSKAVKNVNNIISPKFIELKLSFLDSQSKIDKFLIELDGTPNKEKLGANAILGVSLCFCVGSATFNEIPLYRHIANIAGNSNPSLPIPAFNIINGGSHAGNLMAFQEFMIIPNGASTFKEAMKIGSEIYQILKSIIKSKFGQDSVNVGDEGGFAPNISDVQECLDIINEAIIASGHKEKVNIGLDVAASEFQTSKSVYDLDIKNATKSNTRKLKGPELCKFYTSMIEKNPNIISIEDPFDQDDWENWSLLTSCSNGIQIVADDLTVTNKERIQKAINLKSSNALLLKVNQIGTLTESIESALLAKAAGWNVMVSHRSGETEDTFIADLAVGIDAGQIKSGAPCRSERLSKYNRLLRIEEESSLPLRNPFQ